MIKIYIPSIKLIDYFVLFWIVVNNIKISVKIMLTNFFLNCFYEYHSNNTFFIKHSLITLFNRLLTKLFIKC